MATPKFTREWWGFDLAKTVATPPPPIDYQKLKEIMSAGAYTTPPRYKSVRPQELKVLSALHHASVMLPMRLASRIAEIRFGPEGAVSPCFEVVFTSGRVSRFDNLDTFPTEEDIARIAVECP